MLALRQFMEEFEMFFLSFPLFVIAGVVLLATAASLIFSPEFAPVLFIFACVMMWGQIHINKTVH